MKKTFILIVFVCSTAIGSNLYAQQAAPPGAGDKNLHDDSVKGRSTELERVERDARKTGQSTANTATGKNEDRLAVKYAEIKTDYEQIQLSQDIVN